MIEETIIAKKPVPLDMLYVQEVYTRKNSKTYLTSINIRDAKKIKKKIRLDKAVQIKSNSDISKIIADIILEQLGSPSAQKKTNIDPGARAKAAQNLRTNLGI